MKRSTKQLLLRVYVMFSLLSTITNGNECAVDGEKSRDCRARRGLQSCCPELVCHRIQYWRCVKEENNLCSGPGTIARECGSTWRKAATTCCPGLICNYSKKKCIERPPTNSPTDAPTTFPPTGSPTGSPTTLSPTTLSPTISPTDAPTTLSPTISPTDAPTTFPPTASPTDAPTTLSPTISPSNYPTVIPTTSPTSILSTHPSEVASSNPTVIPSIGVSTVPSLDPTIASSSYPSVIPTTNPTIILSHYPTGSPTNSPSDLQTNFPSSLSGEVLTLPTSPAGSLHNLLKISSDGKSIAPVARSYDGRDWEVSAGEFTSISITCDSQECSLQLPPLVESEEYSVSVSNHTLPRTDQVARFLEQSTFGTTLDELNSFDTVAPVDVAISHWIQNQIENKGMSLHRSWFRERVTNHFPWPHPIARPYHPCEKNTRYRRYAFSNKDNHRALIVTQLGIKFLLSVDNEVRALVNSIDWASDSYINSKGSMPTNGASYKFCREPEDALDGGVKVTDYRTNSCQYIKVNGGGGNPVVAFDTSIFMPAYVELSSSDARAINDLYFKKIKPQNLILTQDLIHPSCANVTAELSDINYHALYLPTNTWYIHTPPPILLDNTVDSPASDGGGYNKAWTRGLTWCANTPRTFLNEDKCYMSYDENACSSSSASTPTMVCGSPGETANNPYFEGLKAIATFDVANRSWRTAGDPEFVMNRKTVWLNNILTANDQLRQRIAWALNEVLVIAAPSIVARLHSEPFLAYYDIMVRNAFGNYRDILREMSFSPLMGENLSFINSKSTAYMFYDQNIIVYPDENFAREIMQLFTIGYCHLHPDGTTITTPTSNCISTYTNDVEIMEYSRVWTGFKNNVPRGNIESQTNQNHIDPMDVETAARDPFPKLGLNNIYIGDKYPLCVDRPQHHFLKKGAKYRLSAGSSSPELQDDPVNWEKNVDALRVTLSSTSHLYDKLCDYQDATNSCGFSSVVVLDTNLPCVDIECDVNTVRVVEVTSGIFYEYIPQPCVQQAFYNDAIKLIRKSPGNVFCSDLRSEVASTACCESDGTASSIPAVRDEHYWGERMNYSTAESRCQIMGLSMCNNPSINDCGDDCIHDVAYWTNQPCTLKIKVNPEDGKVAVVHDTGDNSNMALHVGISTAVTYFCVKWQNEYPTPENSCGGSALCEVINDRCICSVSVDEIPVFTTMPTNPEEILEKLKIGAHDPSSLDYIYSDDTHGEYIVHHRNIDEQFTIDTIFEVKADYGITYILKNVASSVNILGSTSSMLFPNPPHFMSLPDVAKRDALFETEAALDHYFYHDNTAPFVVSRFIQRFGISNPSPRYVLTTASAFRSGEYTYVSQANGETLSFGSGNYGDLAATVAAILLDPEARNVLLDVDPSHGSFREPLLKAVALMRNFKVTTWEKKPLVQTRLMALTDQISQEPFEADSVFSYFLPEFQSTGPVADASLVAPEAQLLTGPNMLGLINGLFTLIKYGITSAHGGFFHQNCGRHNIDPGDYQCSMGFLAYEPSVSSATDVVNELSTLMTSGRLSDETREVVKNLYSSISDKGRAKMMAQQVIATTPEFQTTGKVKRSTESQPTRNIPVQSVEPYKAVVFLFLRGGIDTYNVLVPSCEPLKANYLQARGNVALSDAELLSISTPPETNQVCNNFAIHHKFANLRNRYNNGQVVFFANTGLISEKANRTNVWGKEKSILFAHNRMSESTEQVDPFMEAPGKGILGRMTDALSQLNGKLSDEKYKIGSSSIHGVATALIGTKDKSPSTAILNMYGPTKFDPYPWSSRSKWSNIDLLPIIQKSNMIPTLESSVLGKTWSSGFINVIEENVFLDDILKQASISTTFEENKISMQFMQVAKLIKSKDLRGVDRDVFYTSMFGWDHHADLKLHTNELFPVLDRAIETFWNEMNAQNREKDVILVAASEFGRSLTPNTSGGTDHGWGGNYWMMGGDVKGGKILGKYVDSFIGPLNCGRGRMIPTTSWDSVWNGISQWMGVEEEALLNEILPNRHHFANELFTKEVLFKSSSLGRNLR